MKIKNRSNEKGFALVLALSMLVVLSLMGVALMQVVSNDHKSNGETNDRQQAFYAAETGITEAKRWLAEQSSLSPGGTPVVNFCYTNFFPDLTEAKSIKLDRKNLSEVINSDDKKLEKYSYEYFITYTPDKDGKTTDPIEKTLATSEGTGITVGTSYKSAGTDKGTLYTIYSCGCDDTFNDCNEGDSIVKLEVRVMVRN
jgi:type II secretory pathway pseudopilin PulG